MPEMNAIDDRLKDLENYIYNLIRTCAENERGKIVIHLARALDEVQGARDVVEEWSEL